MDKILIKWPRLTTAQVILGLTLFIALWLGFLTTNLQYNREINYANQQSLVTQTIQTHQLLEKQGNLSNAQRQLLLNQFVSISKHGGFATQQDLNENKAVLADINQSFAQVELKLDKLLNHTNIR